LISYASIGNKFSVKEIVYQLVDKETYEIITERLELEMVPFINDDGALEIPYLENVEIFENNNNMSGMMNNPI